MSIAVRRPDSALAWTVRINGSRNWFAWGAAMKSTGPVLGMFHAPRGLG